MGFCWSDASPVLIIIGVLVMSVSSLFMLMLAFEESLLWGLGLIFFPPLGLVFVLVHLKKTTKTLVIWIGGFVTMLEGCYQVSLM